MKKLYLILLLGIGMFSQQSWAPPIKGEATGGGAAAPDISKCDLNPSKQTKLKVKGEDGKIHFVCTGPITCEGKAAPIYCKVSEKEACPNKTDRCFYLGSEPVKFLKLPQLRAPRDLLIFHPFLRATGKNRSIQDLYQLFQETEIVLCLWIAGQTQLQ